MTVKGIRRGGLILVLCLTSGFVCAVVFTILHQFTLPPTDLAYGMGLSSLLTNPFVFGGMVFGAIRISVCPKLFTESKPVRMLHVRHRHGIGRDLRSDASVRTVGFLGGIPDRGVGLVLLPVL